MGVAQLDPPLDPDDNEAAERLEEAGLGAAHELLSTKLTCAVGDGLKLLRRGDVEEVYDLRADPLEQDPMPLDRLAAERADLLATLRAALEHRTVATRRDSLDSPPAGDASQDELDEIEARMKLLGYM
jgi:hypothetical protein